MIILRKICTEIDMNRKYELGRMNLHKYQIHIILMVLMASKNKYNITKQEY